MITPSFSKIGRFTRTQTAVLQTAVFILFIMLSVLLVSETAVAAPTAAVSLSTSYNQNYDSLSNTGTPTWTDDSTIPGWYSNRTAYTPGTGSSNTGALYSFGAASSSERALGSVASNGTGTVYFGVRLVNDTTHPISLTVNYMGEQWRNGGNTTQQQLTFAYQVGASMTSLTTGTWTPVTNLNFISPIATATAAALDGNLPANEVALSFNIPLDIPVGQEIMLRWEDLNDTGNDHGLAIDNIAITDNTITYNTITPDGNLNDWDAVSQKLGATNSVDYYLTWDATYLYVGFAGGNATNGGDKYNVAVDLDPNDTGSNNSGTTTAFNGVTFGADGKPDYVVLLNNDNNVYKKTGASNWADDWISADSTAVDNNTNPGQVEFRLKWADMGLTDRNNPVGIYVWQSNNADLSWGSYPPTNLAYTDNEHPLTTRIYLPTTDNGRLPRFYAQHKGDETQFNANGTFNLLNDFAQINVTSGGGAGCNFKVAVQGNAASDTNNSAVRRQYTIEPTGCTPTANMTLRYMDGDFAAPDERNGYADTSALKLFRWNGSAWIDSGGTANDADNTVAVTGISAFSPWTFGTGTGPTAVSLQSFTSAANPTLPLLLATMLVLLLLSSTLFIWQRSRR